MSDRVYSWPGNGPTEFNGDVNVDLGNLGVKGDVLIDDGGTFTTTLQWVTPTAARVISLPNATGTVALVAGNTTAAGEAALDGGYYGALAYSNGRALEFSNALGFNPDDGTLSTRALSSLTLALKGSLSGATSISMNGTLSGATTIAMSSTLTGGTTATFGTGYNIGTSVELRADAVNIFSQLRTTSAQAYRLYNTFTSATDFERGKLAWERSTSAASTNGFIATTNLTVDSGTGIAVGQIVTGTGVTLGTRIISGSGTSWVVSQSQTVGTTGARVAMVFGAPALRVGTEKGSGGGTARALELLTDDTTRVTIAADGSKAIFTGDVDLASAKVYKINDIQVVAARVTGWGAPTGTATRTTFATSTVTTEELAQRVKALIDDLTTHGLIGT